MVADPDQASAICGHTFARYAAVGVDITLASASAEGWSAQAQAAARHLGVRDVVLLDYPRRGLKSAELEGVFADLMAGLRPHVAVVDGNDSVIREAATRAFVRVRHGAGSSALPAKLYYRASGRHTPVQVTARINVPGSAPELFVRVHPSPWVTGVLETDLFAGLTEEPVEFAAGRLAS
jgi:hypothetical protein